MAGANSNIQLTDLDFDNIKNNLKTYLQSQNIIKDANYDGSVLSILLDILAYNTHYNAYYLSMVANEMFLDTATKRNSVVSISKLLGYTPKSVRSCSTIVDIEITGLNSTYFSIPKYTKFISEQINGIYYTFVTDTNYYQSASSNGSVSLQNVILVEGEPISTSIVYSKQSNPTATFLIPDVNVDIDTIEIVVQKSVSDRTSAIYKKSDPAITLDSNSLVYFVEETNDGYYQVYFGDGILGKALQDGNVILMSYLVSSGSSSAGASQFNIIDPLTVTYNTLTVTSTTPAFGGQGRETIDSIKFSAPKYYSSQNRAVTTQDYISALTNNSYNFSFDSINVWGGQENDPPVYGTTFISLKPTGAYNLTQSQKDIILSKIINPISVVTVQPQIIDPDYVYIKIVTDVVYDPKKTILSASQISDIVRQAIYSYSNSNLNNFNSTFSFPELMYAIQFSDTSIVTNDCQVTLQKKFLPNLTVPYTYTIDFGSPLNRGILYTGISSSPAMQFYSKSGEISILDGIFIEEIPSSSGGINSISISNKGYGYTSTPTVTITGDGTGATAHAVLVNGSIRNIVIDTPGSDYTQASVSISGGGGQMAQAYAIITGNIGQLISYYYNSNNQKVIFDNTAGTVDYSTGIVTLNDFNPLNIDNPLAQLTINANPKSNIINSSRNRILTIDILDPNSVVINVIAKT